MMLTKGIVLGHHIFGFGMRIDPVKIHIITQIRIPSSQKEVCNLATIEDSFPISQA
jgi:hypothetical protein